jgi:ABC-type nitrate/sulfonate/bicarbonate transport system permease component
MTKNEAKRIYDSWQESVETLDKVLKIFSVIPESFLPYPAEVLEEALNIIAKEYFENGNRRMAENIQATMTYHLAGLYMGTEDGSGKITDEAALLKP